MKNGLAILFGLFLAVFILASLEIFFRFNETYRWLSPRVSTFVPDPSRWDKEESEALYNKFKNEKVYTWRSQVPRDLGIQVKNEGVDISHFTQMPCCVGRKPTVQNLDHKLELKTKKTGTVLFSAHYTIDNFGRRITPTPKNQKYNVLAMGDSYTYGVGVDNEETFPYLLGALRPDAKVYNLGLGASSPAEALYELTRDPSRFTDIPKIRSLVLYTYMDNHLERLFCRSLCVTPQNEWMQRLPYYDREGDEVVFKGHFDLNRPALNFFYRIINSSSLIKYFDVVLPPRFTEKHFDFFADIIYEQQKAVATLFPDAEFYFVLYPGASNVFGAPLKKAVEKRGIKVLDYSVLDMTIISGDNAIIEGDGHPSPIAQFILAQLLNRDLPK